jgi:hypothetical protein
LPNLQALTGLFIRFLSTQNPLNARTTQHCKKGQPDYAFWAEKLGETGKNLPYTADNVAGNFLNIFLKRGKKGGVKPLPGRNVPLQPSL